MDAMPRLQIARGARNRGVPGVPTGLTGRAAAGGPAGGPADREGAPPSHAEQTAAIIANHRANIARYGRLLETPLTELERQFVERRLIEEWLALGNRLAQEARLAVHHADSRSRERADHRDPPPALSPLFDISIETVARELGRP